MQLMDKMSPRQTYSFFLESNPGIPVIILGKSDNYRQAVWAAPDTTQATRHLTHV